MKKVLKILVNYKKYVEKWYLYEPLKLTKEQQFDQDLLPYLIFMII